MTSCRAVLFGTWLCAAAVLLQGAVVAGELELRVLTPQEWGAPLGNVEAVLGSTAEAMRRYVPGRELAPILVGPTGGPTVWHQRGPNGEHQVRLDTGGTYWSQYVYQFAHEFCHILCRYDAREKANKWFEETLCETASLFALRRMAQEWSIRPPYPSWRDYSRSLWDYADERIRAHRLSADTSAAAWYRRHVEDLRRRPCARRLTGPLAVALLPLFERQPRHWAAVTWLNAGAREEPRSFADYLADWHENAPARHRPFIRRLARQFQLLLEE